MYERKSEMKQKVEPIRQFFVEQLSVNVLNNREELGRLASSDVAAKMRDLLNKQRTVRMIFAAAPSQNELLDSLCQAESIDWSRVIAFHLDDYLGLSDDQPQRFSSYLKKHLFDRVHPGQVHYLINPNSPLAQPPEIETLSEAILKVCEDYSQLLREQPIDIICMGIGENGHIAFNDPPVADFNDPKLVKLVELEEGCRIQQVHDGCFATLADVPQYALTLTIPALIAAKWLYCMVPGSTKREAVRRTLTEKISTDCPATILRKLENARLYLDLDSAPDLKAL